MRSLPVPNRAPLLSDIREPVRLSGLAVPETVPRLPFAPLRAHCRERPAGRQ